MSNEFHRSPNRAFSSEGSSRERVRIMLLVSSLERGGAERQVVELANSLDPDIFEVTVCSLSSQVPLASQLAHCGERLRIVNKRHRYDVSVVGRVAQLARKRRIHIIHAFLFDAEMAARLAGQLAKVPVVIASERNTDYRRPWVHSVCLRLTRSWFDVMIANSHAGKCFNMRTLGLPSRCIHVVRNGVDTERFRPSDGRSIRAELGIHGDAPLVGMVASFKRQKNHADFFRIAQSVLRAFPTARFVCVGEPLSNDLRNGVSYHLEMRRMVEALGLGDHCLFIERCDNMPEFYSACDVTMLTSTREGTPNVLLESMACEVPVVATDVADNARVIPHGRVGYVAPVGALAAMTDYACRLLGDAQHRTRMGRVARRWVMSDFSTPTLAKRIQRIYTDILERKQALGRHSNSRFN